jgi:hypothetical protein
MSWLTTPLRTQDHRDGGLDGHAAARPSPLHLNWIDLAEPGRDLVLILSPSEVVPSPSIRALTQTTQRFIDAWSEDCQPWCR